MDFKLGSEAIVPEGKIVIKIDKSVAKELKATGRSYNEAIKDLLGKRESLLVANEINQKLVISKLEELKVLISSAIGRG